MSKLSSGHRFLIGVLSLAVIGAALASDALAQQPWRFKKAPNAVLDKKAVDALRKDKSAALRANGLTAQQQDALKKYYVGHVFAGMTQPEAIQDAMRFPTWRRELVADLERLNNNQAMHDYIRDELVYKRLRPLVTDSGFHPACRYNATLIIGMMNEREGERGATVVPPVPFAKGRAFLIQVVRSKKMPEPVHVAALIGLRRHAELLAANNATDRSLLNALVAAIREKPPASETSMDGYYWRKRLAIEALGALGPGAAASVIGPIVNDDTLPMSLRCAAAKSLGQLNYSGVQVDSAALLKGLGQVAVTACRSGIQHVQEYEKKHPSEEKGGNNIALFARQENAKPEANLGVTQARRHLKQQLKCVKKGIQGVEKAAADAAQKNLANSLLSGIRAIEKGLDGDVDTMTPQELVDKIGPPAVKLEKTVSSA